MKKDIRGKVKRFLTSEMGRTGVRAPLVLGVTGGAILLSQIVHTPSAEATTCVSDDDCESGQQCIKVCTNWDDGTCSNVVFQCY